MDSVREVFEQVDARQAHFHRSAFVFVEKEPAVQPENLCATVAAKYEIASLAAGPVSKAILPTFTIISTRPVEQHVEVQREYATIRF